MKSALVRWDRVKTLLSAARQRTYTDALAELTDLRALLASLQTSAGWQAAGQALRPLLTYAVGYVIAQFASARLAYAMSPRIAGPSPLFIHGGVAISALLLTRPRHWWRYLLLTFPVILIDAWWLGLFSAPTGWWVIVVAYLQVVIMAVVTASLLHRFAVLSLRFATVGEVARFLAVVAIGVVPASLFSTAARYYIWSLDFWFAWRTAYLGFVLGIMTFTPAIVLWVTDAPRSLNLVRREQQTEAALLGVATVLVSVLVFGTQLQDQVLAYALIYLLAPVLIWAAVRFGPFGLASMLALSTVIAVTSAVNNRGPFVTSSASDNVLALQLFLLCIGVPLFFLAALVQERQQADTATRASEARYRAMFQSAAIGVAVTDLGGRPLEVNEYASRMLGYVPDELRTLTLRDFTHPDDVAENEALLRRALEGKIGSYQLEKRYLHKDGRVVWGKLSASLVRGQDGQPAYFVVHLEDVTGRKRLEREREEARVQAERRAEELDRVFEAMADGVAVYDQDGREVRTNAALQRLLRVDLAPPDYGDLSLHERMALFAAYDVEGRPLATDEGPLPRALRGEIATGSATMDIRSRTFDGRDVELSVSAAPLRDGAGQVTGAVALFRDQTERRRLEREHAEQAQQLQTIFDALADPLFVYDATGRLLRANPAARQLLYAEQTDTAVPLAERPSAYQVRDADEQPLPREDWPITHLLRGEVLAGAGAREILVQLPDGRDTVLSFTGGPIFGEQGQLVAIVAIARDQTERRRLEQEREAARAEAERQAAELAATFEAIADGVAVFDTQGQLVRENATLRRLLGADTAAPDYATLSLAEQMEIFAVHDEQGSLRNPAAGPLPRALLGEVVGGAQTRNIGLRTLDGRDIEVGVSAAPLRNQQGEVAGAVIVLRDQTERRRLEQEREAALREAERRAEELDRVFEQSAEGLTVYDAAGRLVRTNAALRHVLGLDTAPSDYGTTALPERAAPYQARDLDGHPLPPERSPVLRALQGEVISGAQALDMQLRTWDGRDVVIRASAAPLRNHEGRIVGAVGVFRDHTERQQLRREREEALARAQARSAELEAVLGAMTDGVVVYDATAHITFTNAAFRTLFAVETRPEYARLSLAERNKLVRARTLEGHNLPEDQLPQARVLRGEVLASSAAASDLLGDTVDGRTLTLQLAGGPLRDADGMVTGAVLVFRDVTAQRHLERATRELAAQLQATLDAMSDAVFLYGSDGQVLRLNAAAQALVDVEPDFPTVAGTAWWDRVKRYDPRRPDGHPLSLEEWPLARVLRGETLTAVEAQDVVLTDARGDEQALNYVGGPARDAAGKLMGYVFVVRDVTERRRLQREWEAARANELAVREVNERLDTFVAMAAHDLRSPVSVSRMVVERAQQLLLRAAAEVDGRAAHGKPAQAVIRAAQAVDATAHNLNRLMRLVQQLLDVSRLKEGTLVLQRQPVDLAELVRTSVDEQRLFNPSRVIAVNLPDPSTDDTAPMVVDADPDRLSQVLTNYLTNAVRYSAEDQPIAVVLRVVEPSTDEEKRGLARVEVRDHGPGIPLEEQATIWERFQRARTVREAAGGLGLGLYIARTIVELHGGQVGVESAPGEGAAFWFTLPLGLGSSAV